MSIMIGDTHGLFVKLKDKILDYQITDEVLIQVGDFGCFGNSYLEGNLLQLELLNNTLVKTNNYLYIIRGNHDNPDFFDGTIKLGYSNINFLPDYQILNLKGKSYLFVGGGTSIDRALRVEGVSWWRDETIKPLPDALKGLSVDYLITHVPSGFESVLGLDLIKHYSEVNGDLELLEDLKKEKEVLGYIVKNVNFSKMVSGHFHVSDSRIKNGKSFYVLSELEFKEI